ncbi:VOC family protein [Aquirufa rosea]|uniref:VOC family protein n=1 Tax=Aquirufa rosea TaxID=2509241 RepID=A0A4Q1BXT6_9BACT|nr:VOC family protein [Aquirufa rosea]RXK47522.1 VOC family protein [Aquirufa rosea]
MPRVCTYVNFPGTAEEAFLFYQSIFKTEFIGGIQRFHEMPVDPNMPPLPETVNDQVLHIELPLLGNHILMASDAPADLGFSLSQGNNMHICVNPDSREEAQRIFDGLSEGANINTPIQDMYWGAFYGTMTDRFGINWMISYQVQ